MQTALLLIDIQNEYFPAGKLELEGSLEASFNAARMVAEFRSRNLPIIHIQHISTEPGATRFIRGTQGAQIHENVKPLPGEPVIEKHYPNSFRDTELLSALKELPINQLVICGMMTHMCVEATTRAAVDLGFKCLVIHDACATRTLIFNGEAIPALSVHKSFLAALNGMYASVISADEFISTLIK